MNIKTSARKVQTALDTHVEGVWKELSKQRGETVSIPEVTISSGIQLVGTLVRLTSINRRIAAEQDVSRLRKAKIRRTAAQARVALSGLVVAVGLYELGRQRRMR